MTEPRFPDRLSLLGLRYRARHGVLPHEKAEPQPFEVDVVLSADLRAAAERDDLAATVDYSVIADLVRAVVEDGPPRDLIESLAAAIAAAVLDATDPRLVGGVEVRVRKPEAPMNAELDTVEAALVRRRL